MKSKNKELLKSFTKYCEEHPGERFWQALRNWAKVAFVLTTDNLDGGDLKDTFYWE